MTYARFVKKLFASIVSVVVCVLIRVCFPLLRRRFVRVAGRRSAVRRIGLRLFFFSLFL